MQRTEFERNFFEAFNSSTIKNYVVPGLESVLLGESDGFKVRMFHMTEHQMMHVTPHSHRFNLLSYVLEGEVEHITYHETTRYDDLQKLFKLAVLEQEGQLGEYKTNIHSNGSFRCYSAKYVAGGSYFLNAEDYHSVVFAKGTKVLFIEGPQVATPKILVPLVKGTVCSTLFTADWMFQK